MASGTASVLRRISANPWLRSWNPTSKSEVVRDAIPDYYALIDRPSEAERVRMLAAFDELSPRMPPQDDEDVDREMEGT